MRFSSLVLAAACFFTASFAAITYPILINCGSATDVTYNGGTWQSDANFALGGEGKTVGDWMAQYNGNNLDTLFRSYRVWNSNGGQQGYHILVGTAGSYKITFYFAEPHRKAAGQRVFDVNVEGGAIASDVDVYSEAGWGTFITRETTQTITDGIIDITFTGKTGSPLVSAIKIEQLTKSVSGLPINVNVGCASTGCDVSYGGRLFTTDSYKLAGTTVTDATASGTLMATYVTYPDSDVNVVGGTGTYTRTSKTGFRVTVGAQGLYKVGVLVHEPSTVSVGTDRKYHIKVNKTPVSANLVNPLSLAGGAVKTLSEITVPAAAINSSHANAFEFLFSQTFPGQGDPLITGLYVDEVDIQTQPIAGVPLYINCGANTDFTDDGGRFWMKDTFSTGGTSFFSALAMSSDPIRRTERYFTTDGQGYSIPLGKAGFYQVVLYYSEVFFTTSNTRLFDVWIEGYQVFGTSSSIASVDIHASAGENDKYFTRTYKDVPVVDGTLDISFVKKGGDARGYPKITAIAVLEVSSWSTTDSYMPENFRVII